MIFAGQAIDMASFGEHSAVFLVAVSSVSFVASFIVGGYLPPKVAAILDKAKSTIDQCFAEPPVNERSRRIASQPSS